MQVPSTFVFTHDSIGLGQDGPTHQPVEQIASLRAIPEFTDFRPADANETAAAWQVILERRKPAFLAFSRQDLPVLDPEKYDILNGVRHGAYVLHDGGGSPDVVLIATGSEVSLILKAATALESQGTACCALFPCRAGALFDAQPEEYQKKILLTGVPGWLSRREVRFAGGRLPAIAEMFWGWIDLAHLRQERSRWRNLDSMWIMWSARATAISCAGGENAPR